MNGDRSCEQGKKKRGTENGEMRMGSYSGLV